MKTRTTKNESKVPLLNGTAHVIIKYKEIKKSLQKQVTKDESKDPLQLATESVIINL